MMFPFGRPSGRTKPIESSRCVLGLQEKGLRRGERFRCYLL